MPVNLKKGEFTLAGVQVGSSSHTFHLEATSAGGKGQSKKLYLLKLKLLHLQVVYNITMSVVCKWQLYEIIILLSPCNY